MQIIGFKKNIIKFISSIITWATIIAALISYFISGFFQKYEAKIISSVSDRALYGLIYKDIDHNGISEKIELKSASTFSNITVRENDNLKFYTEITRNIPNNSEKPIFIDYDNNSIDDMFYITQTLDSLFINVIFIDKNFNISKHEKFVTTIDKNKKDGYDIGFEIFSEGKDINNDGKLDIYFLFKAGYSYQPRKIYCYDVANDSIHESPNNGSFMCNLRLIQNPINQENIIFTDNLAVGNYQEKYENIPYPDTTAWIILLNNQLNFIFPPVAINGYANFIYTLPVLKNDSLYIMSISANYVEDNTVEILYYNLDGKFVSKITLNDLQYQQTLFLNANNYDFNYPIPLGDRDGNLYLFNNDFKTYSKKNFLKSKYDKCSDIQSYDLDNDGKNEKILFYVTGIAIVRNDLSAVCYLEIGNFDAYFCSNVLKKGEDPCFSIFTNNTNYIICYHQNKLYNWQFPIYFAIFFAILILLYLFQKLRTYQLEQENIKLNATIVERTFEIFNQKEELMVQAERLQKLDVFKQKMTRMIVHDLKNPLNLILNSSENGLVINSAQQMNILVENMLDINKFEEAKLNLNIESYNLFKITDKAFRQIKFLVEQKNIFYENTINQNIFVKCDSQILERVFINLLNNAAKFTPNNGKINIFTEQIEADKIKICIADNGVGIGNEDINKIFEEYQSNQHQQINNIRSTGLGLTFCKLAVDAHKSRIEIKSQKNVGTTIFFVLFCENKSTNLQNIEKEANIFNLNDEQKQYLSQYYNILSETELYEISALLKILNQITDVTKVNSVWKEKLENTIYSNNKEVYKELINMIKPE